MRLVRKHVACLVRNGRELLVVDHPRGGTQIPTGTLVEGEGQGPGVVRTLREQTGVSDVEVLGILGTWDRHTDVAGQPERHLWEVYQLRPRAELADEWMHPADGTAVEVMLRCHWLPLDVFVTEALHPTYGKVVDLLVAAR